MPRAILHIGTEKTGTTALQSALVAARETLAAQGVVYPQIGTGNWHAALAAYAKVEGDLAGLPALAGWHPIEDRATFDARIEGELAAAVADHPEALFLFSTEHASSRLTGDRSVARLLDLLGRHFERVDVAVYLRRWDRMAVSAYSMMVRDGLTGPFDFDRIRTEYYEEPGYLEYADMLTRWEAAVGRERMHVAIFDRAELRDGSIVADFAGRFGLPALPEVGQQNVSVDTGALQDLRLVNRALEEACPAEADAVRGEILDDLPPNEGPPPATRAEARAFVAQFVDQAEAIRARYFPDRAVLFDDDFGEYPEQDRTPDPDWKGAVTVLARAAARSLRAERRNAAGSDGLQALLHLRSGALGLARKHIRRAIRAQPRDPRLFAILARVEERRGAKRAAQLAARRAAALVPNRQAFIRLLEAID